MRHVRDTACAEKGGRANVVPTPEQRSDEQHSGWRMHLDCVGPRCVTGREFAAIYK